MKIQEIQAKTLLKINKKIDSWFLSRYSMNLYRGCEHNCAYCDGRAEKYNVTGEFGTEVTVKINAANLLQKEITSTQRRTPLKPGYILLGGGVGDSYQPADQDYQLSRKILTILKENKFPVHILTKSILVSRDLDLIRQINEKTRAIVSMSFSSVDDRISSIFEPNVPPPSKRLHILETFKQEGIACGMFLMPVIPGVTDIVEKLDDSIRSAADIGLDFIIFGGMTLKDGRQKTYFSETIQQQYPDLIPLYHTLYRGDQWGQAIPDYYQSLNTAFSILAKKYNIPLRIPPHLYTDIIEENDRVVVMLEQLDYLLKLQGKPTPYGYAAYQISQIAQPLSSMMYELRKIKGVGPTTERIIQEILKTKNSSYYTHLLHG